MKNTESFGQLVRELRRALDLTQEELARRAGCAAVTLRKIEADDLRPSQQIAERLAMSLNIPLEARTDFVRQARKLRLDNVAAVSFTPTPTPEEIGTEDLSGRAIHGYALGERIGAGGFGVVYRAVQPVVEREVAVKIILPHYANLPEFIRRFEAEAQLVARLEHPHIVPLYDYWREPGAAYLVMRLLRGGSMHSLLQKRGPLPVDLVLRMLEQIGAALGVAHHNGVIHRDLKPANILLDEYGNAYLADFGIAKNLGNPNLDEQSLANVIIGSPAYFSPEQIRSETVHPQADIYSLGVMLYELLTGVKPFQGKTPFDLIQQHLREPLPLLAGLCPDLPTEVDRVIARATAKDAAGRYAEVEELVSAMRRAISGETPAAPASISNIDLPEPQNPYKGLRSFGEMDASDFFGRETLTQQLLARLGETGDLTHFLAVVGPSGSGKSSVVKAGLIPALRRGALPGSENWFIVDFLPGAHPFEELEAALIRIAQRPPESLLGQLTDGKRGLLRAVRRCLPEESEIDLVLVIDQFEELFTLVQDEATRTLFLESLLTAVLDERSRVSVVITLRADFIDRPLRYVDFGELLRQRMELVLPLTPDEMDQAISSPARRVGVSLESGLSAVILRDVSDQPGKLPLLQYALTELFAHREGRVLTGKAYGEIGGVMRALGRRAEEVYTGLDETTQAAVRQLFLRLVTLGEGVEDTRRRVLRTEVDSLVHAAQLGSVIDSFGKSRLLTFDSDPLTHGPTLEVAHEALLHEWPRLREWIQASRADVRMERQLSAATADWLAAGRETSFLLSGARLAKFEDWAKTNAVDLTQAENDFLSASMTERERKQADEADRQQRELEAARKLAKTEQLSAQRMRVRNRVITVAGVIALLLAIAAGVMGFQATQQRQAAVTAQAEAEYAARVATARELAAASIANLEVDPERSVLLALQAISITQTSDNFVLPEASAALHRAVLADRMVYRLSNNTSGMGWTEYSSDGKYLAMGNGSDVVFWDAMTGKKLFSLGNPPITDVTNFSISPDSTRLVTGSSGGYVKVWNIISKKQLWRTQEQPTSITPWAMVFGIAFSWDGKYIATGSHNGMVRIYAAENGELLHTMQGHTWVVFSVAFSPDGKMLASASVDRTARLWDTSTGEEIYSLEHTGIVDSVAFNPDGKSFATSDQNGLVRLWDTATGELILSIRAHNAEILSVRYSSDGKLLSTVSYDAQVKVWDAQTGQEYLTLAGHSAITNSAAFSPDGKYLATGSEDRSSRVWDISRGGSKEWLTVEIGPAPQIGKAVYSSSGKYVAGGSADGTVKIWDANSGQVLKTFFHPFGVYAVSFSPDETRLAVAGEQGKVRVWDIASEQILLDFAGHLFKTIFEISYSPDGKRLITSSDNFMAIVWDANTGKQLYQLEHSLAVRGAAFAPQGRMIATAGYDAVITLWNADTGQKVFSQPVTGAGYEDIVINPDGKHLAGANVDGKTYIFDVASGDQLFALGNHQGSVLSAAYNPDGKLLATGGADGVIWLWDTASYKALYSIPGNSGSVNSLAFSPDSSRLLASNGDGTLKIYAAKIEDLVALAEARLTRTLTDEEYQTYLHTKTFP